MAKISHAGVLKKAHEELQEELEKELVTQFKAKLRELHAAEQIIKNLERDLNDMQLAMQHQIDDLDATE